MRPDIVTLPATRLPVGAVPTGGGPVGTPAGSVPSATDRSARVRPTPDAEVWTSVGVERRDGRIVTDLRRGALAPYRLDHDDDTARVALVAAGALLLGGDHVRLRIRVGAGAVLEIVETSGTVAYDGGGLPARWEVDVVVEAGGVLIWDAQPFVVSTGADVHRSTSVRLGAGAVACVRETVVLGRSGERGGRLRTSLHVDGPDAPVLAEELQLDGARPDPGVLGDHRVIDSVILAGRRPSEPTAPDGPDGPTVLDLAEPGAVARRLGAEVHRVLLTAVAAAWCLDARTSSGGEGASRGTPPDLHDPGPPTTRR